MAGTTNTGQKTSAGGVIAAIVVVLALAHSCGGSSGSSTKDAFDHSEDVSVTSCSTDSYGYPSADVSATNSSSKKSDYSVTVAFDDASGNQIATGLANIDDLMPGQSGSDTASAATTTSESVSCVITTADRMSAVG